MLRVLGLVIYVLFLFPVGLIARILGYDLLRKEWNYSVGRVSKSTTANTVTLSDGSTVR